MKEIINLHDEFEVVGAFVSYKDLLFDFDVSNVDILITDIQLPYMNGIEGLKRVKEMNSLIIPIVVTVHEDSEHVFDALCAGAVGYLVKNLDPQELISSLQQARNGGAPMSTKIARKVVESFSTPKIEMLTKRENEVLQLLAKGKSYSSIAKDLFISLNTVKVHTKKIYEKLHLNSKQDVIEKYGNSFN